MIVPALFCEQAQLLRARLDEGDVAGFFETVGERGGVGERLLDLAELGQEGCLAAGHHLRPHTDPASPAELDPLAIEVEGRLRAFIKPRLEGEVVIEEADGSAFSLLDREPARLPHLLDPVLLTEVATGKAAEAERIRRLAQAELRREGESLVGGRDRLLELAGDEMESCLHRVRLDEVLAGRLGLEQPQRLGKHLEPLRVAEPSQNHVELAQGATRGQLVAGLAVAGKGQLESLPCLVQPILLMRGPRPAFQQQRPLGIDLSGQLERLTEGAFGLVDVEA